MGDFLWQWSERNLARHGPHAVYFTFTRLLQFPAIFALVLGMDTLTGYFHVHPPAWHGAITSAWWSFLGASLLCYLAVLVAVVPTLYVVAFSKKGKRWFVHQSRELFRRHHARWAPGPFLWETHGIAEVPKPRATWLTRVGLQRNPQSA